MSEEPKNTMPDFDTTGMCLAEVLLRKLGLPAEEIEQARRKDAEERGAVNTLLRSEATLENVSENIGRTLNALLTGELDTIQVKTMLYALQTQLATVKATEQLKAQHRKEQTKSQATTKRSAPVSTQGAGTVTPTSRSSSQKTRNSKPTRGRAPTRDAGAVVSTRKLKNRSGKNA